MPAAVLLALFFVGPAVWALYSSLTYLALVYSDEREVREARVERPYRRTDEKEREEHGCRHDSRDVRGGPREHVQRIGRGPERRRSASAPWPLRLIAR